MAVDKETVARVARLARIRIADEQQEALAAELSNILGWVEQLSEVETEGVEPLTSVVEVTPTLREDRVTDGDCREAIVKNAPQAAEGFFSVPKVVE